MVNVRIATMDDLPQLKAVYEKIIASMYTDNIQIWDEMYPCEFFGEDIENERLYVLVDNDEIVSAFALCEASAGAQYVQWENIQEKALYIERFGVHVNFLRKGIGSRMLAEAVALAREKGATYVRLFVLDKNVPAINLYIKNGFERVEGSFDESIGGGHILHEFGFEIRTDR